MRINSDNLGYMSENEVYSLFKKLDGYLAKMGRVWWNSKNKELQSEAKSIETDLCYIIRELECRKNRSRYHAQYIKDKNR